MKHLKRFNEDITSFNFEEELQEFCELNLAYFLDEGNELLVEPSYDWRNRELYVIQISLVEPKSWGEIKDYIIPFLHRLNNKYEIKNQGSEYDSTKDVKGIIDDKTDVSDEIHEIFLYVKGYKQEPKKGLLAKIKAFFK
jgi:hypothetical protein